MNKSNNIPRKPSWLRVKSVLSPEVLAYQKDLSASGLKTVCREAACPNRGECWHNKSFTFILLGNQCTRMCPFCNINASKPEPIDHEEPQKIVRFLKKHAINHIVLTSVTRDDLPDGGAGQFIDTIKAIRAEGLQIPTELLIPDFRDWTHFDAVASLHPDIIGHNIETVRRLYTDVRPQYTYERCLEILRHLKRSNPAVLIKSAILVGLGETDDEIRQTIRDLHNAQCDIVYVGQYLPPSKKHWPVSYYYTPQQFESFKQFGLSLGIKHIVSGPLVRSSYQSWKTLN
ncbi:MAG: lipoyl synthase [Candidatus Auribacterota bacterium]